MHPSTSMNDVISLTDPPQQPATSLPLQTAPVATTAGDNNHPQQMYDGIQMKSDTQNHCTHAVSKSISLVPWSTGLCDCCDDLSTCCLTCWCPCIAFGRIAEIVDRGSTSCGVSGALYMLILSVTGGCACLYSCFYRSKLRGQYFFKESPCSDCCVHCCCEACALCQEYRQLKHLGYDMSIGWHGNMERQKQGGREPPLVHTQMNR